MWYYLKESSADLALLVGSLAHLWQSSEPRLSLLVHNHVGKVLLHTGLGRKLMSSQQAGRSV